MHNVTVLGQVVILHPVI